MPEIDDLAKKMINAVRDFVAKAEAAINATVNTRLTEMEGRIAGVQLLKGDKGEKGDVGPQGLRGEQGEIGSPGAAGMAGPRGEAGLVGPRGETGAQGELGSRGETGVQGERGKPGADGKDGLMGPAGQRGETGLQGPAGQVGQQGEQGKPGSSGERGEVGLRGEQGKAGEQGAPGSSGPQGEKGLPGERGLRGEAGEPGRDAAQLEILPSIDEEKSYRRGTWASHNGGLIKAIRQTDPVKDGKIVEAGWDVMVEGVSAIVVTQEENVRELSVCTMLTSGIMVLSKFSLPVLIYREVWRDGEYSRGDVVTWGGSAWHCQQKTKDKPGTSAAWRLMVKEGAKGKDAEPVLPVQKGPVRIK